MSNGRYMAHVIENDSGIEIVGIRVPAYKLFSERQSYWRELATTMKAASTRRIIFLGDVPVHG